MYIYIHMLIPFSLLPPAHLCFQLGHLLLPQGPGLNAERRLGRFAIENGHGWLIYPWKNGDVQ